MNFALPAVAAALSLVGLAGCGNESASSPAPAPGSSTAATSNHSSGNPLSAPVDYLGAVAKGQQSAVKSIDTAQLKQAIQNFQISEDRFPASLQELVTKGHLRQIPAAPNGMKIDYDATTGVARIVKQ